MTKSELLCENLGKMYFFKEMIKANLIYITETKEEKELADVIIRVNNYILPIQVKEKNENGIININKWLSNKVYKIAKNQTKSACNELLKNKIFKNNDNIEIFDNIEKCDIIPLIIFDVGMAFSDYKRIYKSSNSNLVINIFAINDFQKMCEFLISPMEMTRYLNERKEYVEFKHIHYESKNKIVIAKTISECAMLNFYCEKYELDHNEENINKLKVFNTYLTLFEEHCIGIKDNYKEFIKILSGMYTKKIYCFIDRVNTIIEIGNKKLLYWKNYILDGDNSILFISLPTDKFDVNFINFISNTFMYYFKINKLLSVINTSIDKNNYNLYFMSCAYENKTEALYKEAIDEGIANDWNNPIEEII